MNRSSSRWPLLTLAAVLAQAGLVQAKPIPLKDLTQDLIRNRVGSYLALETTQRKLSSLRPLVRLAPGQITYQAEEGKPRLLQWKYQSLKVLTETERETVSAALEDVLNNVFGNHLGGLLTDQDALKVLAVTKFVAVAPVKEPDQSADELERRRREQERQRREREQAAPLLVQPVCMYYAAAPGYWNMDPQGCGLTVAAAVPVYYYPNPYMPYALTVGYAAAPVEKRSAQLVVNRLRRNGLVQGKGPKDAPALFWRGVELYRRGDSEEALTYLSAAVQLNSQDARFWYYKALAERSGGDTDAALVSARRGAALELLGRADPELTLTALERIQGEDRRFLRSAGDVTMTREQALQIAAEPVPGAPRPISGVAAR
jgi:hypothetical protein